MPIFRYDSDGYPGTTTGAPEWKPMSNLYRWNGSIWQKIKKVYRFNSTIAAKWQLIFEGTDAPQPKAPVSKTYVGSTTYGTLNSETEFYSGDTIRTTRGDWTQNPTSIRIRVQYSSSGPNSGYATAGTADKTYNSSSSPTLANTTSDTYQSYTILPEDALYPSYYFKGLIQATNADGTTPLETAAILARLGFSITNFARSSITSYGATFSWNVNGITNDSNYISSQTLTIRRVSDNVVVKTVDVAPGTSTAYVNDSSVISPNTQYYAKIVIIARDSWFLTATPTQKIVDNLSFTTLSNPPINTVAPTIGPLNNRGYLPVSTTLTATQGTWTNVSAGTTYEYDWWLEDSASGSLQNTGYIGNTRTYTSIYVGDYLFVRVKATNPDGSYATAVSSTYILDQAIAIGSISPTSVNQNASNNFSFSISHYPTSYTINWGDGTSNYSSGSITSNTSTVNASIAHTYTTVTSYTLTVTAQPGNVVQNATITVNGPIDITLNANGGTISSGPGNGLTSYTYSGFSGSSFTAPSATRTHYSLFYWRYPQSGGDPYFLSPGTNYTFGSLGLESARTYWAIWNANTYTVTYNYNGGTGTPSSNSAVYPGSVTLPTPDARTGYTFNGWYTASSGGTYVGTSGGSYSPTSNITLYAQWSAITYSVTFNANGGTLSSGSGNGQSSYTYTGVYGSTFTVPSATRSGYTFSTWRSPLSGGDPVFATPGTTYTITGDITFYAIWTANNLTAPTITLVSQSTPGGSLSVYFTGGSGPYYQIWWQTSADYSGVTGYDANGSSSPVTDTTGPSAGTWYVAVRSVSALTNTGSGPSTTISSWSSPVQFTVSQATYTVTWNANGGSGGGTTTQNVGVSHTAPSPGTRSGYTFNGYYNTPSGDYTYGPIASGGSFNPPSSITMYARWTASGGSAPTTPTNLVNTYNGGTSYTFSWDAVSGATSYQIIPYHATDSVGTGSTAKTARTFTSGSTYDSSVDGGTSSTYVSFAVRATNANGSSAYSAIYTPYR